MPTDTREERLHRLRNLGNPVPADEPERRFLAVLRGEGPADLYELGQDLYGVLCWAAPPRALLDALTRQQERSGNVPAPTWAWVQRWRAIDGSHRED